MGDFFIGDYRQFEKQIIKIIEGFYFYKTKEKISIMDQKLKDLAKKKILEFLTTKNDEHLIEKIEENDLNEFSVLMNLCQLFYNDYCVQKYQKTKKNTFNQNLSRRISSEIIDFRNHFAHTDKNISSEYILRFYENFYFYLKIVCVPEIGDILIDFFKKDLHILIKYALEMNIQKENTFQLFFNMENKENICLKEDLYSSKIYNLKSKELKFIYNSLIPEKLIKKYRFQEEKIEEIEEVSSFSQSIIDNSIASKTLSFNDKSYLNNSSKRDNNDNIIIEEKEDETNYEEYTKQIKEEDEEDFNKYVKKRDI